MSSIFLIFVVVFSSLWVDGETKDWSVDPINSVASPRVSTSANYIGVASINSERIISTSSKIPSHLQLKFDLFSDNGTLINQCVLKVLALNKFGLIVFLQLTMISDERAVLTWIDNSPMVRYAPPFLSFWLLDTHTCEHADTQIDIQSDDGFILPGDDKYFSVIPYGDKFDLFFPNQALCKGGGCRLTMNNDGKMIGQLVSLDLYDFPALWNAVSIVSKSPDKGHILYRKNYQQFDTLLVDKRGRAVKFASFNTTTSSASNNRFTVSEPWPGVLGYCFIETPRRLNCSLVDPNLNVFMERLIKFDFDVIYVKMQAKIDGFQLITVSKDEVYTVWRTIVLANGYLGQPIVVMNLDCEFSKLDLFIMHKKRCVLVTCTRPRPDSLLLKEYKLQTTCF